MYLKNLKTITVVAIAALASLPASAGSLLFSTGNPDGLVGTASEPSHTGRLETETADDFILTQESLIRGATFIGLLPVGFSVNRVEIEFYGVFPFSSTNPPSGHVPTRTNSPSDVEIGSATRDSSLSTLSFSTSVLSANFTVANTVVNGINPIPNQFTGGEGAATGQEVLFDVTFATAIDLLAGHYFFRPEVGLSSGDFLWLSASKPIVSPGTPFAGDLQSWIRNSSLSPDWLRIGTDITHQGPFNAAFSLTGDAVPEPSTWMLLSGALGLLGLRKFARRRR